MEAEKLLVKMAIEEEREEGKEGEGERQQDTVSSSGRVKTIRKMLLKGNQ